MLSKAVVSTSSVEYILRRLTVLMMFSMVF
jgi:hypothetical protein